MIRLFTFVLRVVVFFVTGLGVFDILEKGARRYKKGGMGGGEFNQDINHGTRVFPLCHHHCRWRERERRKKKRERVPGRKREFLVS